jgi:signal peptidase II
MRSAESIGATVSTKSAAQASPARRVVPWARAGALLAVVLIVDRITKHLVVTGIPIGAVHRLVPGIELVHIQNNGVAFGFLSSGGAPVLVLVVAALLALVVFFVRRPTRRGLWIPTGLLVGGAIGNLIDRLSGGSVTDFIKLPLWPAFNVSDMAITFGVLSLLYVLEGPRRHSEPDGD